MGTKRFHFRRLALALQLAALLLPLPVRGEDYDEPPIEYSKSTPSNRVSRLIDEMKAGRKPLEHEPGFGYLRSILEALEIPSSSQMLVFSKTSMQRERIWPESPRALYFNDDTYVGFCQQGEVMEISAADDALGAVFYALDQREGGEPRIVRQTENCLICHGSSPTRNVPGHLVRSVYADSQGLPILTAKTYRTDPTSPLSERWGGWYVTGTHGAQRHLGNLISSTGGDPELADNSAGQNRVDLAGLVDASRYLEPGSDIVALMVLEHQAAVHNCVARAGYGVRQALHYERELNRELGKPADERWDSTARRIKSACEPLLESLLFAGEAPLTGKIQGTSGFAAEFSRRGPRDSKGRSLRDFDLERRMFKHPCSYLIHSSSFSALPPEAKDYVFARIRVILAGGDPDPKFGRLSPEDRTALREILEETLPEFAAAEVSPAR